MSSRRTSWRRPRRAGRPSSSSSSATRTHDPCPRRSARARLRVVGDTTPCAPQRSRSRLRRRRLRPPLTATRRAPPQGPLRLGRPRRPGSEPAPTIKFTLTIPVRIIIFHSHNCAHEFALSRSLAHAVNEAITMSPKQDVSFALGVPALRESIPFNLPKMCAHTYIHTPGTSAQYNFPPALKPRYYRNANPIYRCPNRISQSPSSIPYALPFFPTSLLPLFCLACIL